MDFLFIFDYDCTYHSPQDYSDLYESGEDWDLMESSTVSSVTQSSLDDLDYGATGGGTEASVYAGGPEGWSNLEIGMAVAVAVTVVVGAVSLLRLVLTEYHDSNSEVLILGVSASPRQGA